MKGRKPDYKNGTRGEIIKAEHMDGLVTNLAFELMDTPRTYKDKAREMLAEGVLRKTHVSIHRHMVRVYTLNHYEEKKDEYLPSLPEGYYEHYVRYMSVNGRKANKSNKLTAERAVANANTAFMMQAAGIKRNIDEKPRLLRDESVRGGQKVYYTAREIKWFTGFEASVEISKKSEKKVLNSRLAGLAITLGGVYPSYYIGSNVDKWKRGSETRMKVHLENLLKRKTEEYTELHDVLFTTTAYEKLGEFLEDKEMQNDSIMQLSSIYSHIYVLPYTKTGRKMLSIMSVENWKYRLFKTYAKQYLKDREEMYSVKCDGYSPKDDSLLCLFMDCDVRKLNAFTSYAKAKQNKERFVVICFDWQKEIVRKACGGACRTLAAKFEPFYQAIMSNP